VVPLLFLCCCGIKEKIYRQQRKDNIIKVVLLFYLFAIITIGHDNRYQQSVTTIITAIGHDNYHSNRSQQSVTTTPEPTIDRFIYLRPSTTTDSFTLA